MMLSSECLDLLEARLDLVHLVLRLVDVVGEMRRIGIFSSVSTSSAVTSRLISSLKRFKPVNDRLGHALLRLLVLDLLVYPLLDENLLERLGVQPVPADGLLRA